MKIRNGFVSNSSSSSFLIYKLDSEYTKEEHNKLCVEITNKWHGTCKKSWDSYDKECYEWLMKKYKKGYKTIYFEENWDNDNSIVKLLKKLDVPYELIDA